MKIKFTSFVEQLLVTVPELKPIFDEHVDNYDDVLEHVLMGDISRFVIELNSKEHVPDCLGRLLEFLDRAFSSGDEKLQELISVSFLENVSKEGKNLVSLKRLLSEALLKELSIYET